MLSLQLSAELLATSLAMHESVPHGRPCARPHASLECLREVVGWRNGGAHLWHRVVVGSSRETRSFGQVEITRGGQGCGGETGGVGCRGDGEVTVRGRRCGADGLRGCVWALGTQIKTQRQGGGRCTHAGAVLLRVEERAGLEVRVAHRCG